MFFGHPFCVRVWIATVELELGYTCSAGVGHNKKFAKMIASRNKPNGQTILPTRALKQLLSTTYFRDLQVLYFSKNPCLCGALPH